MPVPSEMSRQDFVATFGGIFEHSPWIAEETYDQGLGECDSAETLHEALCKTMRAAGHERQLALIRAHPDLAGKLAIKGGLTEESRGEQASAGLDQCSPEEFARFSQLNADYVKRFGFPFILAVRGSTKEIILAALEARMDNSSEAEFETALTQIERIAGFRLADIYGEQS